jgi:tRNA (guanine-N7-)-methyltransferase
MKIVNPLPKLTSSNLPWPTDWTALFGAARPLILEIGFGFGHFLEHLSRTRPDANIIGLEVNNECIVKAERAIPRKGMHNVRVIYTSAETALHHLFEPSTLSEVHINFPDPWFKTRHAGRRLMQRDTLDAIVSRMQPGAKLYLATDILDYAEMTAELLEATPGLDNLLPTRWAHEMAGRVVTKYERKAQEAGRPCHYFAYMRNTSPAPDVPVMKEIEMPHMVIKTPLSSAEILAHFQPGEHTVDDVHVRFMQAYDGRKTLLFEAYVHEPTIEQHLSLVFVARDEHPGEYTLKLGTIGNPRPTEGAHVAVALLGRWLIGLSPETTVIQDKVRPLKEPL